MQPQKHPILIVLTLILVLMAGAAFILMQDSNPADERGSVTIRSAGKNNFPHHYKIPGVR